MSHHDDRCGMVYRISLPNFATVLAMTTSTSMFRHAALLSTLLWIALGSMSQATAQDIHPADRGKMILARPGYATHGWHTSVGLGKAWLTGQAADVFDDSSVSARWTLGYDFYDFGVEVSLFGAGLVGRDERFDIGTVSVAFNLVHYGRIITKPSWRLSWATRMGFGGTGLMGFEDREGFEDEFGTALEEYGGPSMSLGGGLVFELGDPRGLRLRVSSELMHEWFWLENDRLARHIHGGLVHWTTSAGLTW